MPWIKVIQEHESEGELKEAYERMRQVNIEYNDEMIRDMPAGPPKAHPVTPPELSSLNPLSMLYGRQFMMQVMRGDSRVTPAQREMIATVTSLANNCRY
jgi:hypothetical protein